MVEQGPAKKSREQANRTLSVSNRPGTVWETWDNSTNSHNHPALTASIGPFLYSLAGLDVEQWSRQRLAFTLDPLTSRPVLWCIHKHAATPTPKPLKKLPNSPLDYVTYLERISSWIEFRGLREIHSALPSFEISVLVHSLCPVVYNSIGVRIWCCFSSQGESVMPMSLSLSGAGQ
eukprot:3690898-Amphidinium_carterae.1